MLQPDGREVEGDVADPRWKGLYTAGGVAALVAVLFFRRNLATELVVFDGFGILDVPVAQPTTALGWFQLFQDDGFVGLLLFDVTDLISYGLVALIYLALYGALHRTHKGAMAVATSAGLVGLAVYFASNQASAMLNLSRRHAAAATDGQRAMYEAAGEALLAIHNPGSIHQGTGIYLALFLVLLAGLITSIVMLKSDLFFRATAIVGIIANGLAMGRFLIAALPPELQAIPTATSAPFRVLWIALVGIGLLRMGRSNREAEPVHHGGAEGTEAGPDSG